ncbi:hypothetical protein CEXT_40111 [Caerostris extrusa]|uniref:Uncharacterized protein n=1 Tax=Caerostris extrusa TaxID=172846 RepID=A0AAV4MQ75_CAEEX|nr:hypothetical protein CEXT_40111 [Caerostris extrusa]
MSSLVVDVHYPQDTDNFGPPLNRPSLLKVEIKPIKHCRNDCREKKKIALPPQKEANYRVVMRGSPLHTFLLEFVLGEVNFVSREVLCPLMDPFRLFEGFVLIFHASPVI